MKNIIDEIGYQGPMILTILTATQIWSQTPYFIVYLAGFFINKQLNELLKNTIREPRPQPFDLKAAQERDWFKWFKAPVTDSDGIYISKAHLYGMPSGHAESAAFAVTFYVLLNKTKLQTWQQLPMNQPTMVFLFMVFVYALTMYQRWSTKAHTMFQLFVGTLVGMFLAGTCVFVTKRYIQTKTDIFSAPKKTI